ncbi:MAG TPA: methyltransferase [Gammaproteobacteria bacterium]|nr:methyltransferase [Gammaproteobacteria bacterium]
MSLQTQTTETSPSPAAMGGAAGEVALDPSHIMQTATAFWASKVLLTAVEFDLFTALGDNARSADQLGEELSIHPRGRYDFFDTLVAAGFLQREGDGAEGRYRNTPNTAAFLNRNSPAYIGGLPEMLNARLFGFWNHLGEALRTGQPQNEIKHTGKPIFEELYADQARLGQFLDSMTGFQAANFMQLAEEFDFSRYKTVSDIGGALALLSRIVGGRHPHLRFTSFDLPPVAPLAQKHVEEADMADRIKIVSGDFFADPLPKADVITMGNILHDWNLEKKKVLIKKAYDALPEGGALIAIENLIDDARRENLFGLLMSLNMLIEFGDAFDYTGEDFRTWCKEAGFKDFEIIGLAGPTSAAVAYK